MQYQVTFRLGGEERTEEIDAPDAATAVQITQLEFGRSEGLFELISVQLEASDENDFED